MMNNKIKGFKLFNMLTEKKMLPKIENEFYTNIVHIH